MIKAMVIGIGLGLAPFGAMYGADGLVIAEMYAMDPVIWIVAIVAAVSLYRSRSLKWWPVILSASFMVGAVFSPIPGVTWLYGVRVLTVSLVVLYVHQRQLPIRWFGWGFVWGACTQVVTILLYTDLHERTAGTTWHINLLGAVAFFVLLAAVRLPKKGGYWPGVVAAAFLLAVSGSLAPWFAAILLVLIVGRSNWRPLVILVVLFVGMLAYRGDLERLTAGRILDSADARIVTAKVKIVDGVAVSPLTGGAEIVENVGNRADGTQAVNWGNQSYTWHGTGMGAWVAANGWPRPHNMYFLAFGQMGIFLLVPIAYLILLIWRGKARFIGPIIPLFFLGIMDDSAISPVAPYLFGPALLIIWHYVDFRNIDMGKHRRRWRQLINDTAQKIAYDEGREAADQLRNGTALRSPSGTAGSTPTLLDD